MGEESEGDNSGEGEQGGGDPKTYFRIAFAPLFPLPPLLLHPFTLQEY